MLIAIDFDGTFAEDPKAFTQVAFQFLKSGHNVVTVTSRRRTLENEQHMREAGITWPILFAPHDKPKKRAAIEAGWNVDVWVDDQPHMIGRGDESLECVGVFENELRHALRTLKTFQDYRIHPTLTNLMTRLETVLGVDQ